MASLGDLCPIAIVFGMLYPSVAHLRLASDRPRGLWNRCVGVRRPVIAITINQMRWRRNPRLSQRWQRGKEAMQGREADAAYVETKCLARACRSTNSNIAEGIFCSTEVQRYTLDLKFGLFSKRESVLEP